MSDATPAGRWRLDWPTSAGFRVARAELKSCPKDFQVDEEIAGFPERSDPGEEAGGDGEHLCLRLQKTGDNTEFVARELAVLSGCRSFDVGFCGMKDRHAVTSQWFSLYRPGMANSDADFIANVAERWRVLGAWRHNRKLRRGEHRGNRFIITLRGIDGRRAEIDEALTRLEVDGAPNYFGPQRFGFGGANLDRAATMDASAMDPRGRSGGRGRKGKHRAGREASKNVLYFSAARSWLFNEVLARRVADGTWLSPIDGEPGLAAGEPEATGPLWGDGGTSASGLQEMLERGVVEQAPGLVQLFSTTRMKPERRALRARPAELAWYWQEEGCLRVEFTLAPGQYATTILSDIFELEDMSLGRHNKQQS
ncbi:tRNA pseudouridine(13) synthase TruD [Marinobacter sp. F4206]|uniref:tRNA pseudouridine(13) synthase TruD n=1 Tax=Marinobacter sp. F4206 TaxID=2861777 RepID=UPI001C5F4730|nr:tRNA pseudouridine(13) synthase TruD [Marinobacter sp. F4206]MBW4936590.1 tRNA pseudouridine(13) synthase TruD [Marinobacter sp. F4206]